MTLARFLMLAAVAALALATLPAATAETQAPDAAVNCVTLYDFPDNGEKLCWDLGASGCKVWEVRTTFIGTQTNCIVGGEETTQSTVNCYEVYSRTDVGTYSIVRRSSCAPPEVYECPYDHAPIDQCRSPLQAAVTSSSSQECLDYYQEWTVGPVHHVQQDSCHSTNSVCGTEEHAYLAEQESSPDPAGLASCTVDSLGLVAAAGSPLHRTCYHSGQGELQSQDCVDPTSTSCTVYMQRSTGVSSDWWCYPSMQHGSWN
jgi:hypothetical protein